MGTFVGEIVRLSGGLSYCLDSFQRSRLRLFFAAITTVRACRFCLDKVRFGGTGRLKRKCIVIQEKDRETKRQKQILEHARLCNVLTPVPQKILRYISNPWTGTGISPKATRNDFLSECALSAFSAYKLNALCNGVEKKGVRVDGSCIRACLDMVLPRNVHVDPVFDFFP